MAVERDIPAVLEFPGQRVVVTTKGSLPIAKASVGSSRQTSTVTAAGKWVPPAPPPVDPPPVDPPPVDPPDPPTPPIHGPASKDTIWVRTSNQVLQAPHVELPYDQGGCIRIAGTRSNPLRNITIKYPKTRGGNVGILAEWVENLRIEYPDIGDADYAGVLGTTIIGGGILGGNIARIGLRRDLSSSEENNAYGVAWSNYGGDPPSSDIDTLDLNVEDVWHWHAFDTHNGVRTKWIRCTSRRAARAMFITRSSTSPLDTLVQECRFLEAKTTTGGTNKEAVTLYIADGVTFVRNDVGSSYPQPPVLDYQGQSKRVVGKDTFRVVSEPAGRILAFASTETVTRPRNDHDDADLGEMLRLTA